MRTSAAYRSAIGLALAAAFLLIWLSLGVGIIGKDGDPANMMYFGVLAVGFTGVMIARLQPSGMARALYATALAQALVAAIALITELGLPYSPPAEILLLNGFFVAMFVGSAWLFRRAARGRPGRYGTWHGGRADAPSHAGTRPIRPRSAAVHRPRSALNLGIRSQAMIDHLGLPVSHYEQSKEFFLRALAPLGAGIVMEGPYGVGLGSPGKPTLWLHQSSEKVTALHLAFSAESRSQVREFHAAAMAAGGKDNGEPGLRPHYHPNYYGAFVIGPDGHNVEAVCHEPET